MLRSVVQSFDVFDTLIARRCVDPLALFCEVGVRAGRPDFAQARVGAERWVGQLGRPFDIDDIYARLVHEGYCDAARAEWFKAAEIEAEFDNAIPILPNLLKVRDFDLVISDMYLPASVIRGLLHHVGLRRFVHLFVTNSGKADGTIWPEIGQRWLIQSHLGDDAHSDVAMPKMHAIASIHFQGAAINAVERYLAESGLPRLAKLARTVRLANPFGEGTVEAAAWDCFADLNVPLLCILAWEALQRRISIGGDSICFVGRDGYFLNEIFLALFPGEKSDLAHVSRRALRDDSAGCAEYLASLGLENALVCDLVSTGLSWLRFARVSKRKIAFFALVFVDNYQYEVFDAGDLGREPLLAWSYALRASFLPRFSKALEAMNTAPHGSTERVTRVGRSFVPTFFAGHELPQTFVNALLAAQGAAMARIRLERSGIVEEVSRMQDRVAVMATLVATMSGNEWLNQVATNV